MAPTLRIRMHARTLIEDRKAWVALKGWIRNKQGRQMKWAIGKFHTDKRRRAFCTLLSCWCPCEMLLQLLNKYKVSGEKNAPRLLNKHTKPHFFWKVPEAGTVLKRQIIHTCHVQAFFSDHLYLAIFGAGQSDPIELFSSQYSIKNNYIKGNKQQVSTAAWESFG